MNKARASWWGIGLGTLCALLAGCGGDSGDDGNDPGTGPKWSAPQQVATFQASDQGFSFSLGVDRSFQALAVWEEISDSRQLDAPIQVARFTPNAGWGAPSVLARGYVRGFAMGPGGEAVLRWGSFVALHQGSLVGSHFTPSAGWGGPVTLIPTSRDGVPHLGGAVDAGGRGMDVWTPAQPTQVLAARSDTSGAWERVSVISSTQAGPGLATPIPSIGFDSAGNALAVWGHGTGPGAGSSFWFSRHPAGGAWGAAVRAFQRPSSMHHSPRLAVGADGRAAAVWTESVGGQSELWASTYSAAAGWAEPSRLGTGSNVLDIGIDGSGNALVVWSEGQQGAAIRASRSAGGQSWTTADVQRAPAGKRVFGPRLGLDAQGKAVATWIEDEPSARTPSLMSSRHDGSAWTSPVAIVNDVNSDGLSTALGVAADGRALAVWIERAGSSGSYTYSVRSSRLE